MAHAKQHAARCNPPRQAHGSLLLALSHPLPLLNHCAGSTPDEACVATHQVFNRVPMLDSVNTGTWLALEAESRSVASAWEAAVLMEVNVAGYMTPAELADWGLKPMYTKEAHSADLVRVPDVLLKVFINPAARQWCLSHVINNPALGAAKGKASLEADLPPRLEAFAVPPVLLSDGWERTAKLEEMKARPSRGGAAGVADVGSGAASEATGTINRLVAAVVARTPECSTTPPTPATRGSVSASPPCTLM